MDAASPGKTFQGVGVSEGIGMGTLLLLAQAPAPAGAPPRATDAQTEVQRYQQARQRVWEHFRQASSHLVAELGKQEGGSLDVYTLILKDSNIDQEIELLIESGLSASAAVERVFQRLAERQKAARNEYLRERSSVWRDVSRQLQAELLGGPTLDSVRGRGPLIIAARELTPFALINPPGNIKGFAREIGGVTDHASLLARAYGIPMVLGIRMISESVESGAPAIIDGGAGTLFLRPAPDIVMRYRRHRGLRETARPSPNVRPVRTKDGRRIALLGNLETSRGLAALSRHGAEGVGLFRSEFLFMHRDQPPTEEEQFLEFQRVAAAFPPRLVTIRTADFGGDKLPPYFSDSAGPGMPSDLRGIRFCLAQEGFFRIHLRAILRASASGNLRMMLPLVPGLGTLRRAKALIRAVMDELAAAGIPFDRAIPIGVMIEVPSAAIMAQSLAREADFFSIGTNDLLQYTLGVSRGDQAWSDFGTSVPPSIIHLIQMVADCARRSHRPVGVCGELASQTWAIPLLVGLGVEELSMAAPYITRAKELVRRLSFAQCRALAQRALRMDTASEVRDLLHKSKA
jgi:phosphotransferase system enzyme I (PtsI)